MTLEALLRTESVPRIGDAAYWFCGAPACAVVYFASEDGSVFSKGDLVVRVGAKELPGGEARLICYCFGYTIEEIESEVQATGSSGVLEAIKERMQGGCSCVTMNPLGSCCLALVAKCVEAAGGRTGGAGD